MELVVGPKNGNLVRSLTRLLPEVDSHPLHAGEVEATWDAERGR